jgi:hypothetical protein
MIGLFFEYTAQAMEWATAAVILGVVATLGEMWRDKRGVASQAEVEALKEKVEGMSERLHRAGALIERLMTLEDKVDTILVGKAMASKEEEEEE